MRSRQGGQCCTARYHRDNITSRWSISGTGAARCAKAGSSAHVAHAQCCCAVPPILLQPWVQQHTWEACNPGLTSLQAHHPAAMRSLPACAPVTPIEHPYMHACMQCLSLLLPPTLCRPSTGALLDPSRQALLASAQQPQQRPRTQTAAKRMHGSSMGGSSPAVPRVAPTRLTCPTAHAGRKPSAAAAAPRTQGCAAPTCEELCVCNRPRAACRPQTCQQVAGSGWPPSPGSAGGSPRARARRAAAGGRG